ncbi:MAG: GTPase/DUF3482 domain-containing protein [Myxococcota bacterium]
MSGAPEFAVVGRVNKGKSSIVSTLTEDDSVAIGPTPGTTLECRRFSVRVDGANLFTLIDTPGFEDAERALAWMKARESDAASRATLVREFVDAHRDTDEFVEECRLLGPILEGAGILYVVDGAKPYRPNYEAEMEILRWTGQPRMALVNKIGDEDHADAWHRALDQYFTIVRDFNAVSATFDTRLAVLRSFRELRVEWAPGVDAALDGLLSDRRQRYLESAMILRDLLVKTVGFSLSVTVSSEAELESKKGDLETRYHQALRDTEKKARKRIEGVFKHHRGEWSYAELERSKFDEDLFAQKTWKGLGLSSVQIIGAWSLAGAAVGGTADVMVGGASLLTGTVVGGVLGAGMGAYHLGKSQLTPSVDGVLDWIDSLSGQLRYKVGPTTHANFPFVVLDRALLHYLAVVSRTHAAWGQGEDTGGRKEGLVTHFSLTRQRKLTACFKKIQKSGEEVSTQVLDELFALLREIVEELDHTPG